MTDAEKMNVAYTN